MGHNCKYLYLFLLSMQATPCCTMNWWHNKNYDASAIAATALGALGLGALYWYKSTQPKSAPAQKTAIASLKNAQSAPGREALACAPRKNVFAVVPVQQELNDTFKEALIAGDLRALKNLAPRVNINMLINDQGETALFHAARTDDRALARFLLEAGINPAIQNKLGRTALMSAIIRKHPHAHMTHLLLHNLPRRVINMQDNTGMTALMYAVAAQDIPNIETLLFYGADATLKNKYGISAAQGTDNNYIKFLLRGALCSASTTPTSTPTSGRSSGSSNSSEASNLTSNAQVVDFERKYDEENLPKDIPDATPGRPVTPRSVVNNYPFTIAGPTDLLPSR